MKKALDDAALNTLFREARSYNRWTGEPVSDQTLHELYELLKFGPTSANSTPARFVFVKSAEAKAKLVACVSPGNVVKVEQAPVTAIIAMDEKFYEKLPKLFPQSPGMAKLFEGNPDVRAEGYFAVTANTVQFGARIESVTVEEAAGASGHTYE